MNNLIASTLVAFALSGCATDDYARYATMQERVAEANSMARIAEAKAIEEIGKSGSEAAKVAAVMTLRSGAAPQAQPNMQAPKSVSEQLMGWASILVPSIVQGYSINAQTQLGIRQSDNGAAVAQSTNNAFAAIAGKIQAPVTVVPQANVTTTTASNGSVVGGGSANTLSGTGSTGNGGYSTNANPTTTTTTTTDNHSNSNNVTNPITGK